ncbi:MAG: cupin domain-containing protein [Candidatus Latescibacteria bacterium]|nr:cupin domain-containing protein [Candidatus Latescibacterota bacterium]
MTKQLPSSYDALAPDGAEVRVLLELKGGSMAHFALPPGQTSRAVTHRSVEEIWFFLAGCGEMWRRQGAREEVVSVGPGVCLTIPAGTHFQFRAFGDEALAALGVTMPPWPGEGEAIAVQGKWESTFP